MESPLLNPTAGSPSAGPALAQAASSPTPPTTSTSPHASHHDVLLGEDELEQIAGADDSLAHFNAVTVFFYRLCRYDFVGALCQPTSSTRRGWKLLVFLFVIYNAISLPIRYSFHDVWHDHVALDFLYVVDYLGDVLFLLDIVLNFYTPYNDEGFFIHDPQLIKANYLRSWFVADCLASLPLGFLSWNPWKHALLRLPRLIRLLKYDEYFQLWEQHSVGNERLIRFIKLIVGLVMFFHYMGCTYIAVAYMRDFDPPGWLPSPELRNAGLTSQYIHGFFWAANIMTGEGGAVHRPTNDFERILTLCIAMLSVFVVAVIIGNVAELIASLSADSEAFQEKMSKVNMFMSNRALPKKLQARIRHYFVNIIRHRGALDDSSILDELPASLRKQAILFMNKDIIAKVPIFKEFSTEFINALVSYLRPQIYSPLDIIVSRGDVGSEMYFIRRGKVQVINNGEVLVELHEGAFFGEIALLDEDCRRTATIRAASFCDLFVLTRENLDSVFRSFPEEKATMRRVAELRRATDDLRNTLSREPLFANFDEDFLIDLTAAFTPLPYTPGVDIFRATDEAHALYFLARGVVHLLKPIAPAEGGDAADGDKAHARHQSLGTLLRGALESASRVSPRLGASPSRHSVRPPPTEKLLARIQPGTFFGGIGYVSIMSVVNSISSKKHTYKVTARVEEGEVIAFQLTQAAVDGLLEEYPDYHNEVRGFCRKYRNWKSIAKQRFLQLLKKKPKPKPIVNYELTSYINSYAPMPPIEEEDLPLFLDQLKSLYTDSLHGELTDMTNGELLLASEILQGMNQKLSRHLFVRHARAGNGDNTSPPLSTGAEAARGFDFDHLEEHVEDELERWTEATADAEHVPSHDGDEAAAAPSSPPPSRGADQEES